MPKKPASGWSSHRHDALPPDWATTRARIMKRDHGRCQHIREDTGEKCGAPARDVDHIIPHTQGGSESDDNLRSICEWHHVRKSGREGGIASGKVRATKKQAAAPLHPGLMPAPPKGSKPPQDGNADQR